MKRRNKWKRNKYHLLFSLCLVYIIYRAKTPFSEKEEEERMTTAREQIKPKSYSNSRRHRRSSSSSNNNISQDEEAVSQSVSQQVR